MQIEMDVCCSEQSEKISESDFVYGTAGMTTKRNSAVTGRSYNYSLNLIWKCLGTVQSQSGTRAIFEKQKALNPGNGNCAR
eukprot:3572612-Amphidinium_carterae.1